jgi:deoxyribonuclease-4
VSNVKKLFFGTAGIPISSKARNTVSGIERSRELGLGCMEVEFVRGVKMGEATAKAVKEAAEQRGIKLSVHAPYYINLNSPEPKKKDASIERIKESARIGSIFGARSIVFHPAFYMKSQKSAVYIRVKKALEQIIEGLRSEGVDVVLRPEITGKRTQFGSLEELLKLSADVEGVQPCIDFSHLHARGGRHNSRDEFRIILERIEELLGRSALDDMHIHISGIEYTRKGEKNHLNLNESDLRFQDLIETWKEFNINGLVICESPNLEGDTILLQNHYNSLGE